MRYNFVVMPQDTCHPDYDKAAPRWKVVADVLEGEDAVKKEGTVYLPSFEDTETDDYNKYKDRADFFEVTARALTAMVGFLYRRDPRVEAPGMEPDDTDAGTNIAGLDAFLADATLTGKDFYDAGKDAARLVVPYGRGGFLIDWSEDEKQPFIVPYNPADIINWRFERINQRVVLTMVMLHEYALINKDDYEFDLEDRWRELRLAGPSDDLSVVSVVWRLKDKGAKVREFEQVGDDIIPMRGKDTLKQIPFVFLTPEGNHGETVAHPPLLGMARQNLSLYRTTADVENACHVLGMPTPWASGFGDDSDKLYLGSSKAWTTPEMGATCGFLALSGADLAPLTEREKVKMERMAMLGARMLDPSIGNMPEAYATVALRQTGETASLVDISLGLTQSLSDTLAWALWWSSNLPSLADAKQIVSYTVNTDFVGASLDASTITALFGVYLQRGMSFESLFQKLQGADIIPADRTVDEEKALIAKGESLLLGMSASDGQTNGGNGQAQQGNKQNENTKNT